MTEFAMCHSCGADIFWSVTSHGKRMPVDATPVDDGNLQVVAGEIVGIPPGVEVTGDRFKSHFATCPAAQEHRVKSGPLVPKCSICQERPPDPKWREVVGWEEIRAQGGANKIAHRKETGRVICPECMYALDAGADPVNQLSIW